MVPLRFATITVVLLCFATSLLAQTGVTVPSLAAYDSFVTGLLTKYNIPGASLAVAKDGRLVLARGYGFLDAQRTNPVQPNSLFRIASLSKFVTGVAVMKLVEQGKLNLDAPAFALLPDLKPPAGATVDARISQITIRQLLHHSGGWDRESVPNGYDPMFIPSRVTSALGVSSPPSTEDIIRYMLGLPLDFSPGTRYAYSNFGYAVLGRIVERVTGTSYEQWVRANIFAPAGIATARIGNTLLDGRLAGESEYIGTGTSASLFLGVLSPVKWQYGGWYLEAMDAHGGWVISAIDYSKFLNAIDGRRGARLLSPASVATLTNRPALPGSQNSSSWYAMGTSVNTANHWWHSGSIDGTAAHFIRTSDGYTYVILLNARAQDSLFTDLDNGFWQARAQVTTWPTHDLFSDFPNASQASLQAPSVNARDGGVNGATFLRGIVSGSWFTVFGANLSSTTRIWTGADITNGALPTTLDGVSVTVDDKPAYVYYISPTQINAQAPAGLVQGWHRLQVTRDGVRSTAVLALVTANAPGVLTYPLGGRTYAVATTADGTLLGDPSLASGLATTAPGATIVIYSTGLVASPAGTAVPVQAPLTSTELRIGGRNTTVTFAGLISPGLFQINGIIPDVADGHQELVVTHNGVSSAPGVVVFVKK